MIILIKKNMEQNKKLEILDQQVKSCQKCDLHKTRTQTVFGSGFENSDIMIIAEAPGQDEDLQGEPLVGKSGKYLNELLNFLDIERKNIYIANTVKCRPPSNRNPTTQEISCCFDYLKEQIKIIVPKVIICLGKVSGQLLSGKNYSMGYLRDLKLKYNDDDFECDLVITYHPSYALRREGKFSHDKEVGSSIISDFQKAIKII